MPNSKSHLTAPNRVKRIACKGFEGEDAVAQLVHYEDTGWYWDSTTVLKALCMQTLP